MSLIDAALGPEPSEIESARERIAGSVRRTPLERSHWLSERAGHDVYLKLEAWQPTRSFKVRGAFNAVAALSAEQRARGLVTASAGNHGQAVALAARAQGARATVFIPRTAPDSKRRRIEALGATISSEWATYDDAYAAACGFAERTGATFVHAFSDRAVVAGQGTIGLEILADLPAVRTVIVPVGGGGLIAGVGVALKSVNPAIRVVGVQSTATRDMYEAFRAGRIIPCPPQSTLADGLAGQVDETSFQRARAVVDELVLVDEDMIAHAIRALFGDGVLAEGSAAVGVAAVAQGVVAPDGPTVIIVTGGNIDARPLATILAGE